MEAPGSRGKPPAQPLEAGSSWSALTWMSSLAGVLMAAVVAMVSLPLLWQARALDIANQSEYLERVTRLVASQVRYEALEAAAGDAVQAQRLGDELTVSLQRMLVIANLASIAVFDGGMRPVASVHVDSPEAGAIRMHWGLEHCGHPTPRVGRQPITIETVSGSYDLRWLAACSSVPNISTAGVAGQSEPSSAGLVMVLAQYPRTDSMEWLGYRVWITVLCSGAIAVMAVILSIRRLLRPIERVSSAAQRIARGERGVRVALEGPDEIRALAHTVNNVAFAVETHEDEVVERQKAVTRFARQVAHEVRNPLQSLVLLTNLAASEQDEVLRGQHLEAIENEIRLLDSLVQRFLRAPGPMEVRLAPGDPVRVVTQVVAAVRPGVEQRGLALSFEPHEVRGQVVIDESLFHRAVENLLINALDAAKARIVIGIDVDGEGVLLAVDDDGVGVPVAARERIFEPYVTGRASGTGLGLALVKQVAEAHRGTVRCVTSVLGGARFEIWLPLSPR